MRCAMSSSGRVNRARVDSRHLCKNQGDPERAEYPGEPVEPSELHGGTNNTTRQGVVPDCAKFSRTFRHERSEPEGKKDGPYLIRRQPARAQGRLMRKTFVMTVMLVLGSAASLLGQDVAVVNPNTIRVKLDNVQVRVLEATIKPGVKEKPHSHPASIVYVVTGGRMRTHLPDGTTSDATYTAGQTVYRDPVTHWAENIGKTTVHLIVVELKQQGSGTSQ